MSLFPCRGTERKRERLTSGEVKVELMRQGERERERQREGREIEREGTRREERGRDRETERERGDKGNDVQRCTKFGMH